MIAIGNGHGPEHSAAIVTRGLTYSPQCWNCGLGLWKDPGDVAAYREKQLRIEAMLKRDQFR